MRIIHTINRSKIAGMFVLLLLFIWLGYTFIINEALGALAGTGSSASLRMLIAIGANVNTVDNNRTPLIYAIEHSNIENAIVLITCGANVNIPNSDNKCTPLMGAVYYGRMPIIKCLISHGANINARDGNGESVLGWAEDGSKDGYGAEAAALLKKLGAVK